jgi:predicted dehydrogenase
VTRPVAFIGCGLIAAKRLRSLSPGFECRALYDSHPEQARSLAATMADPPVVAGSALEALERAGGGLAVVATSHDALASSTIAALECGLDVLVEKPGGRSVADLRDVEAAAEQAGRVVRVGFNHRFHPSFMELRRILATEDVGPLMHIRARYGHGGRTGYEREWRADRVRSGGGELVDQGVHLIDLVRSIAGDVSLAFSELRTDFWDMDVEDNAFLALRCADGGFAWLHASWTEWKNLFSFEVAFRHVKFEVAGLGGSYGTQRLACHRMRPELGPPDTVIHEYPRGDVSWAAELMDVARALDGGEPVGAGIADAIATMSIVKEAYER